MPILTYATTVQFFQFGLPQTALGAATIADVQAALDSASSLMDDYFNGRYNLPFVAVSLSVAEKCCHIAAFLFLSGVRGYNPDADADKNVKGRYDEALAWCDRVQRRAIHPIVTDSGPDPRLIQPEALSSSVVNVATGQRAATRCW